MTDQTAFPIRANPFFEAVTREWTEEERKAECLRLCGPFPQYHTHRLCCPVLHQIWKTTKIVRSVE